MRQQFKEAELLKFGNEYTIKGIVFGEPEDKQDLIVYFPKEKYALEEPAELIATEDELYVLFEQLDQCNVEGHGKIILKKGIRNLDQKICWEVYRRDKYKCRYCGIDNVPLTVDHIITWESGGATHPDNLLTCCKKCNRKRGNLDYGSWLQHKYCEAKSQFLSQKERDANEAITRKLAILPRMKVQRSR